MARSRKPAKRPFHEETPPELRWPLGPLPTGVLLFCLALVDALALGFPDGALSGWLLGLERGALGWAAYLTPLLIVGLGFAAWRPAFVPERRLGRAAIVSWVCLLAALAGMLQPIAGRPQPVWDGDGGGLLGYALHTTLESLFGQASAGFVLLAAAVVAGCVAGGVGVRHVVRGGRAAVAFAAAHLRRPRTEVTITINRDRKS